MPSHNPQLEAPLCSLPVDLFLKLTDFLPTADFCAFRSTCQLVKHRTDKAFVATYFTRKQFMVTTPSLTGLNDIARHEVFSQSLQRFTLATDSYEMTVYHGRRRRHKLWEEAMADQNFLLSTGLWRSMLVSAFRNLPNLRVLDLRDHDSARFRDGDDGAWHSLGATTVLETMGTMLANCGSPTGSRHCAVLLQNLLLAAAEAQIRPVKLMIKLRRAGVSSVVLHPVPAMLPVLRGLETVHLEVDTQLDHEFGGPRGLILFINSLSSVKRLQLNCGPPGNSVVDLVGWLARSKRLNGEVPWTGAYAQEGGNSVSDASHNGNVNVEEADVHGEDEGNNEDEGNEDDNHEDENHEIMYWPNIAPQPFAHLRHLMLGNCLTTTHRLVLLVDSLPTLIYLRLFMIGLRHERGMIGHLNLWRHVFEQHWDSLATVEEVNIENPWQHYNFRHYDVTFGGLDEVTVKGPNRDEEWLRLAKIVGESPHSDEDPIGLGDDDDEDQDDEEDDDEEANDDNNDHDDNDGNGDGDDGDDANAMEVENADEVNEHGIQGGN